MNLDRLAENHVDTLLVIRLAARVAQLNVMVARRERELLQLAGHAGITAVHVDYCILRRSHNLHFTAPHIWIPRIVTGSPAPIGFIPAAVTVIRPSYNKTPS